jgi:invasion protein IalB
MLNALKNFLVLVFCLLIVSPVSAAETARKNDVAPQALWSQRCNDKIKDEGTKRGRCEIFQRLIVKESGKRFVEAAVSYPKGKTKARGVFIVPLGILLQPGLILKVDDGKPFKFQVRYCDLDGCFGFVDLSEEILEIMRNGQKVTITFQALNKQEINAELGLKDFAKALKEVS